MASKRDKRSYVPENLEYMAKYLAQIKGIRSDKKEYRAINLVGLQQAIWALPKEERKKVENYWGLTGKINHSKRLTTLKTKDVALLNMSNEALVAVNQLFRIDYLYMFDLNVQEMVKFLNKKISKNGLDVSDVEAVKYLMAFLVILENGPKMAFENNPLEIDTECRPDFTFDEYSIIESAVQELKRIPDKSIQLKLIKDFLDMLDFTDMLSIKKSFCIEVPIEEIPEKMRKVEIEPMYTFEAIRNFKERVFEYGGWEVVSELILGDPYGNIRNKIDSFMECIDMLRKDWTKVSQFKVKLKKLVTSQESRTLAVYNIGGLEFTDIYEVMFLYLEPNLLVPKN